MTIGTPKVIISTTNLFFKSGCIEEFSLEKIVASLKKETGLPQEKGLMIANSVARKVISFDIKILTSPMLREFVCYELLINKMEKERALYTSPRIPFYDFDLLVNNGHGEQEIKDQIFSNLLSQYNGLKQMYKNL